VCVIIFVLHSEKFTRVFSLNTFWSRLLIALFRQHKNYKIRWIRTVMRFLFEIFAVLTVAFGSYSISLSSLMQNHYTHNLSDQTRSPLTYKTFHSMLNFIKNHKFLMFLKNCNL